MYSFCYCCEQHCYDTYMQCTTKLCKQYCLKSWGSSRGEFAGLANLICTLIQGSICDLNA